MGESLRALKSQAQLLKPAVKLGKAGVSPQFLEELKSHLARHPLVKIRFEAFKEDRKKLSRDIAEATGSVLVLQVGHTAVYHRAPAFPENAPPSSAIAEENSPSV